MSVLLARLFLRAKGKGLRAKVALRPPPAADKGSKSAAQNKEYGERALSARQTTGLGWTLL